MSIEAQIRKIGGKLSESAKSILRFLTIQNAFRVAIFAVLVIFFEHVVFQNLLRLPEDEISLFAPAYQRVLTLGKRNVGPRFTTLVLLNPANGSPARQSPGADVCAYRQYLAQLLAAIGEARPRGVLLDVVLDGGEPCRSGETEAFQKAASNLCQFAPVLTAKEFDERTAVMPAYSPLWAGVEEAGTEKGKRIRDNCSTAISNGVEDTRRVPLYFDTPDGKLQTLAWAMATAVEPAIRNQSWARAYIDDGRPLFTTMLSIDDYWKAGRVIDSTQLIDSKTRAARSLSNKEQMSLTGQIVVMGSVEEKRILTYLGKFHGHIWQASALEAMLDGRMFGQYPEAVQLLIGFICLFVVEAWSGADWRYGVAAWFVCGLSLLCLNVMSVMFFGFYGDFVVLSVVTLLVWLLTELNLGLLHPHPTGAGQRV